MPPFVLRGQTGAVAVIGVRHPIRLRRDAAHQPVTLKALAMRLPARAQRTVTWREGRQDELASRFAAVRVRPAHLDTHRPERWPVEWLLIEWPETEAELDCQHPSSPRRPAHCRAARVPLLPAAPAVRGE